MCSPIGTHLFFGLVRGWTDGSLNPHFGSHRLENLLADYLLLTQPPVAPKPGKKRSSLYVHVAAPLSVWPSVLEGESGRLDNAQLITVSKSSKGTEFICESAQVYVAYIVLLQCSCMVLLTLSFMPLWGAQAVWPMQITAWKLEMDNINSF